MSRVEDWLREAEMDLKSAGILLGGGQYHHACFHAQQAAEKALKALLRSLHKARTGHSVLDLLRVASRELSIPDGLWDYARILDQYYIPPRYPNAFSEGPPSEYYTRGQAEEALRYAVEMVDFVKGLVREGSSRGRE